MFDERFLSYERNCIVRGELPCFYTWGALHDDRGTQPFCTKLVSKLLWFLLRIWGKGKAMPLPELPSTSQISCKIKCCVFQYDYFLGWGYQLLKARSRDAPSGAAWVKGIQICSFEEQQIIGFTAGMWKQEPPPWASSWGGRWEVTAEMGPDGSFTRIGWVQSVAVEKCWLQVVKSKLAEEKGLKRMNIFAP